MDKIKIYVINHNNRSRRNRMKQRFSTLDINFEFTKGSSSKDSRIKNIPEWNRHAAPCMLAHLDTIQTFLNTKYEYGIICEDDIHIKKSFKEDISFILNGFKRLNLDILLLGYLINYNLSNVFSLEKYNYYDYSSDLWGAQMYLISRKYAKFCISTFTIESTHNKIPFSSDWTITKNGNKALIYPMLAVEEGNSLSKNRHQKKYHDDCHRFNYNENYI